MQEKMERISARELHKIVWAMVGVFGFFSLSYPLAMWRVSQHEKFAGFPVKSFPLEIKKVSFEGKEKESFVKTSFPIAISSPVEKLPQKVPVFAGKEGIQTLTSPLHPRDQIPNSLKPDTLVTRLYQQINRSWQTRPTFNQNLVYRVQIRQDNGTIASFEPLNEGAQNYVSETPLPELVNRQSQESRKVLSTNLSEFTVVFTPEGVLEVGAY